jgi:PIN domain nuclease of toxin-antitoxin system
VRAIIDTHAVIWAVDDPERLGSQARAVVGDPSNEILFSAGSIWELAIKIGWESWRCRFHFGSG